MSSIHVLNEITKRWDVFLVGIGMATGFTVIVLKLLGFFG